jgi:hypothetical protein
MKHHLNRTTAVGLWSLPALVAMAIGSMSSWGADEPANPDSVPTDLTAIETVRNGDEVAKAAGRRAIDFPERPEAAAADPELFTVQSWYVPPPPRPPAEPQPPPKPAAPPLPFSFLGSYTADGGPTVFYLVKGDAILDVHIGDTLDGAYTVDAVQGDQLLLTYTPLQQKQALTLKR